MPTLDLMEFADWRSLARVDAADWACVEQHQDPAISQAMEELQHNQGVAHYIGPLVTKLHDAIGQGPRLLGSLPETALTAFFRGYCSRETIPEPSVRALQILAE